MRSMSGRTMVNHTRGLCLLAMGLLALLLADPVLAGHGNGSNHGPKSDVILLVAGTPIDPVNGWGGRKGPQGQQLLVSSSFSVATVRDLYLYSYWTTLSDEHLLTARLYGPDGNLYQQRLVPVSTTTPVPATRLVPGVENPVEVQQTIPMRQMQVITVQLPVAGTWITQHHLLGTWRVELFLDDASVPSAIATFALTE